MRPDDKATVTRLAAELDEEMLRIRRHIHAHPELSWMEQATSDLVAERLSAAGLAPQRIGATGIVCDIGPDPSGTGRRRIALRADLDALPVPETTGLDFASRRTGVSHACGHDVHTSAILGAGLVLAGMEQEGRLPVGVRLVFQPSEEGQPSGARTLLEDGVLEPVEQIYSLHCAPKLDVGAIGSRIGPITAASDTLSVTLRSSGGHTSRPHLTGDLVYALGQLITQLPAVLDRRLDPRSGVNLTWGAVEAGAAANTIPTVGTVTGTLRSLDVDTWERAGRLVEEVVPQLVAPFDVAVSIERQRGIPPVDNDEHCVRTIDRAARSVLGFEGVQLVEQSLGGEDFAWYLTQVPGAMIRLGTRTPGGPAYDLHQGDLVVDERAVGSAMRIMASTAVLAGQRERPVAPGVVAGTSGPSSQGSIASVG